MWDIYHSPVWKELYCDDILLETKCAYLWYLKWTGWIDAWSPIFDDTDDVDNFETTSTYS